jgi:hypothetical protein
MDLAMMTITQEATSMTHGFLVSAIQSSFDLFRKFVSKHHEPINDILSETDLISKLEIVQALIEDCSRIKNSQQQSLQKSLYHLSSVVNAIVILLQKIEDKIRYHQSKYFCNWRSLDYEKHMEDLKKNIKILDMRYHMFIEIMQYTVRCDSNESGVFR